MTTGYTSQTMTVTVTIMKNIKNVAEMHAIFVTFSGVSVA